MVQNQAQPVRGVAFPISITLNISHCLNDLLQAVVLAIYPLFKKDLSLSFAQVGLITLVCQVSTSAFQPLTGLIFDKCPIAWSPPTGTSFTLVGMLNLVFASNLHWLLASVFIIGIGSSVLHPETSHVTFLASGGKRGLAQSLLQMGGNLGGSLDPLLVALSAAPYGRHYITLFAILALVAICAMFPICRWYRAYLNHPKKCPIFARTYIERPLSPGKTVSAIMILIILVFSKYIYMASLNSYYAFYLIHKFNVSIQQSQLFLFVFLVATTVGTLMGGPIDDKVGCKYVIRESIPGTAPFSLSMPHAGLVQTVLLSFCVGLMLLSALPAILLYAQELLPNRLGLTSGLFSGFVFGVAGIASAVLGNMTDKFGIDAVYNVCTFMPLSGLVTWFLLSLRKTKKENENNWRVVCIRFLHLNKQNPEVLFRILSLLTLFSTSFFLISILPPNYSTNFVAYIYESSK